MDETKIITGLCSHDEQAFSEAIAGYSRLLWAVAGRHLSKKDGFSKQDIEECVADVFVELWRNNDRYDPEKGSLKSYLCMLASRKAIDRYRKAAHSKAQAEVIALEDLRSYGVDEPFFEAEDDSIDYRDLYDAIISLPEPSREILIRRYFYQERPKAIAEKMQLPIKEIENRLYRAKRSLFRTLPFSLKEAL